VQRSEREKDTREGSGFFDFRQRWGGVEFNDVGRACAARVLVVGTYALNPFIFRPMIKTFGETNITLEIDSEGVAIGRLRVAHSRVNGSFAKPEMAVQFWQRFRSKQVDKRQKRIDKEAEWNEAHTGELEDKLLDARYVAFKRTDGGLEYGAAVLKCERGKPGSRKVLVKTKDFQEVWISELEIVKRKKGQAALNLDSPIEF
jgi:hypothetical protein